MAHIIGPNQCHRGEQLGLKLYLHNFDSNRMLVTVTLFGSNDYKYVHVGSEGIVASYNAELLSGDQEVLIYVNYLCEYTFLLLIKVFLRSATFIRKQIVIDSFLLNYFV